MWHIRMAVLIVVGAVLLGEVHTVSGRRAHAATSQQPPRVFASIPGTMTLPPHGMGTFGNNEPPPPGVPPSPGGFESLSVRSESDQSTTVSFTGSTLTVTAPEGYLVQFLSGCMGPIANPSSCPASAPPNVVCKLGVVPATCLVTFTTVRATAGQTETVPLAAGCTNVSLTWPNGTPTSEVAAAVTPAAGLVAIWRYDAAARTFQAFSPQFPQASDLMTVNRLDAVFICMREPGSLARPIV